MVYHINVIEILEEINQKDTPPSSNPHTPQMTIIPKISGHVINHSDNNNVCMCREGNKPKLNFKNCLFLVVRHLPLLIYGIKNGGFKFEVQR
ncbi:hypothetical protein BBW68_03490 [Candidatus Erwinia dacicola]|uniref:Uncharacterized protein n=1 Tax=Candidatus Erwinia dacicola TaxID=252393 RepID=A0A1E7YUC0_9GAMM|nr:hypothetical protein BBW68_03490 [Candidatus Erwinia dacicola]